MDQPVPIRARANQDFKRACLQARVAILVRKSEVASFEFEANCAALAGVERDFTGPPQLKDWPSAGSGDITDEEETSFLASHLALVLHLNLYGKAAVRCQ